MACIITFDNVKEAVSQDLKTSLGETGKRVLQSLTFSSRSCEIPRIKPTLYAIHSVPSKLHYLHTKMPILRLKYLMMLTYIYVQVKSSYTYSLSIPIQQGQDTIHSCLAIGFSEKQQGKNIYCTVHCTDEPNLLACLPTPNWGVSCHTLVSGVG